jgi:hypothetical protein
MSLTADLGQPIASTSTAGASDEKQIAIRLSTKDAAYTIPPAKFLVPASWRRFHLSELINKVLENGTSLSRLFLSKRSSFLAAQLCKEFVERGEQGWHRMIKLYDIGILRSDVFEVSRTMSNIFLHFLMPSLYAHSRFAVHRTAKLTLLFLSGERACRVSPSLRLSHRPDSVEVFPWSVLPDDRNE